jgi:uncharacterized protein YukE
MAPPQIRTSNLWDLKASPGKVAELAEAWRALQTNAESARDTVDQEARRVLSDDAWHGDTADAYESHRSKLSGDIGQVATIAGPIAQALEEIANTLTFNQDALTAEWANLAGIPVTENGDELTFSPQNEEQATRVNQAIAAARDYRSRVDEVLDAKKTEFDNAKAELREIGTTWQPRSVRMVTLNAFMGGTGNQPWPNSDREKGFDPGDVDEFGQLILDSGADVATLQEVFRSSDGDLDQMEELRRWLVDHTGDHWDLHFAAAKHDYHATDSVGDVPNYEPFGNAILVRHGGDITGSEELDEVVLQEHGGSPLGDSGPEGRNMEGAAITLAE